LQTFEKSPSAWQNDTLAEKLRFIRAYRRVMTGALEIARTEGTIGSSLQAELVVYDPQNKIDHSIDWAEQAIASKVTVLSQPIPETAFKLEDVDGVGVEVRLAAGEKCQRCWKVLEDVGIHSEFKDVCGRCADVVSQMDAPEVSASL